MSVISAAMRWFTESAHWSGPDGIPNRVLEHVEYTGLTVAIAAAIAIPLGLWIGHTGRFRSTAVVITGAVRSLPTLGLLTWMVLLLGIGLTAPIIALVALAVPPLLAGAYSGLEAVDRETIDAARAIGMTEWQILTKVELPLATELIIGGFRSATLQVVSTATVAAYVSLGGIGRYLFDGLALHDYPKMVAGSVLVIVIAFVLDGMFGALQRLATNGHPTLNPATTS